MADRRLEKLYGRRTTTDIPAELLNEAYSRLEEDEAIKYAIGAMQEIDPAYTQNTFKEGYRVENQLNTRLNRESKIAEFCFQGSVMCDTHIKAYSDIDLVTLTNKFYTLEPPLVPTSPYIGDALEDLKNLRKICAEELKSAFPEAHLDESKSKALSLEGGSLRRKVDIVIGSWWDTVDYNRTNLEHFRGINVLDLHHNCRINNKPFLHNKLLDDQDSKLLGNLRKVIRLLKSLKYDSEHEVDISSFDIASIAYRMPNGYFSASKSQELILVANTELFLRYLIENENARDELYVINNMRKIFGPNNTTLKGLKDLHLELRTLLDDIERGLNRSFRKLTEARIEY